MAAPEVNRVYRPAAWSDSRSFAAPPTVSLFEHCGEQGDRVEKDVTRDEDRYLRHFRDLLHWLSREWEPDVLVSLSSGPLRYSNLLDAIRSRRTNDGWSAPDRPRTIADSVLNRTLRQMERDELVERLRDDSIFPPVASYRLTATAVELLHALTPAIEWTGQQAEVIERVQQLRRGGGRPERAAG